jgi:hypothetical protein
MHSFDFNATVNKATVLLENDDGTPFMSWTDHSGGVAEYSTGATALGYLPPNGVRLGHVSFLTDFDTFFDSEIVSLDSAALWTNLFLVPESVGATPLFVGIGFLVLARRRS